MCLSGAMYYDEDEYDDEEFYNKNSKTLLLKPSFLYLIKKKPI